MAWFDDPFAAPFAMIPEADSAFVDIAGGSPCYHAHARAVGYVRYVLGIIRRWYADIVGVVAAWSHSMGLKEDGKTLQRWRCGVI